MANLYTTSELIDDILLLGHVPTGNNTFTPANLLRLADMEMETSVMKQIMSTRGGYYLTYTDYTTAADGLYVIPSDAVCGALANVELINGPTIIPVNIIQESEQFSTITATATSYGCFLKGNFVQILPIPNIGTTRIWFFKRNNQLILTSSAGQVTNINGAVLTVSSLPSTMLVGTAVDVLGDQPPFNILSSNLSITNISGTDLTLSAVVTNVSIGDWVALNNQTPIPQIPVEYRVILAQRVVCKIYELQGYLPKMEAAQKKLKEYEDSVRTMITPRIQSQSTIINVINGGFLGNSNRMTNFPAGPLP